MRERSKDPDSHQNGDKIRIKVGNHRGERAIILSGTNELLDVQLGTLVIVRLPSSHITNYSLAARRAWQTMPKRAGRPKSSLPRKKMVSLRIDVGLWAALERMVELGLISSREKAINEWLREKLAGLLEQSDDRTQTV